jgi:hypothetical protein
LRKRSMLLLPLFIAAMRVMAPKAAPVTSSMLSGPRILCHTRGGRVCEPVPYGFEQSG